MRKKFSVEQFAKALDFEILYPGDKETFILSETETCRPGLQFTGFFNYFEYNRVQIVGLVEYMYLEEQSLDYRRDIFERYFSYDIPCVILTRDLTPHDDFLDAAREHGIPVYTTNADTTEMKQKLMYYLCSELAPSVERHGVLMDIYGVGIMLVGESGIGKSETALELVKRKHRLIADDVVKIKKITPSKLVGLSPKAIRYLLEIRGIGILDISKMYGISSVLDEKPINLIIELEMWNPEKQYERIGLSRQNTTNILDVDIPYMLIPVRPGRNLAIVIEAAARYYILRTRGVNPGQQLEKRLLGTDEYEGEEF